MHGSCYEKRLLSSSHQASKIILLSSSSYRKVRASMPDNLPDIILVEDNPHDIEWTLQALQECNPANRVKVLTDGEQAVNCIFREGEHSDCGTCEHPSLIIFDIGLPGDGLKNSKKNQGK